MKKQTTIFINNDTSNPISVQCVIEAEKENGNWQWYIDRIVSVGLVVGDKEEIDISPSFKNNPRAIALITSQVASEDEQIIDAFEDKKEDDSLFELLAESVRRYNKVFYGIDVKGGNGI
jgi:hypothetical protein